jgi:hypothetical protein
MASGNNVTVQPVLPMRTQDLTSLSFPVDQKSGLRAQAHVVGERLPRDTGTAVGETARQP